MVTGQQGQSADQGQCVSACPTATMKYDTS